MKPLLAFSRLIDKINGAIGRWVAWAILIAVIVSIIIAVRAGMSVVGTPVIIHAIVVSGIIIDTDDFKEVVRNRLFFLVIFIIVILIICLVEVIAIFPNEGFFRHFKRVRAVRFCFRMCHFLNVFFLCIVRL